MENYEETNALANQANRYMDSLIGFDQNMALSKYPSNQVQKAYL